MFSSEEVVNARHQMVKARKALDDYEAIHGYAQTAEHQRLIRKFNEAAKSYLVMSNALSRERSGKA